jgi:hypothetical protein
MRIRKLFFIFLVLVVLTATVCQKQSKSGSMDSLLPESSSMVLKIKSIASVFNHLMIKDNTLMGKEIPNFETIKQTLGFNPFDIKELETSGINPNGSVGISLNKLALNPQTNEPENLGILVCIPVIKSGKTLEFFENTLKKLSPQTPLISENGIKVIESPDKTIRIGFIEKSGYLLAAITIKSDLQELIKSMEQKRLADNVNYQKAMAKIGNDTIVFYMDYERFFAANPEIFSALSKSNTGMPANMEKILSALKGYKGMGLSLDLEKSDFIINGLMNFDPASDVGLLQKDTKYDKNPVVGISEKPVFIMSFALNINEYIKMLTKMIPQEEGSPSPFDLSQFKDQFGFDIQTELLDNLAGNINLGVFDGGSITIGNFNTVLSFNVKDEAKFNNLIEKIKTLIPDEKQAMIKDEDINGIKARVISLGFIQIYLGISKQSVIIATSKNYFEKAVAGNVQSGFAKQFSDQTIAKALKGNGDIFYLSIEEIFKIINNFAGFIPQNAKENLDKAVKIGNYFDYLLAVTEKGKSDFKLTYMVKTKFTEPFVKGIKKMIDEMK